MKILIIGDGAREHALVWKLAQSSKVTELFVAPGNAGTAQLAENLPIAPTNIKNLMKVIQRNQIELVVVGPEASLAAGIADRCREAGVLVFGPTKAAARIESSKAFAKELMENHGIPCASGKVFFTYFGARRYLLNQTPPIVVKTDGLAAGKGVVVARTLNEALVALYELMVKERFGQQAIVDEYLQGREISLMAFTDGSIARPIAPACDYKRVFDEDKGLNTGGMGSYSSPELLNQTMIKKLTETIIIPAVYAIGEEARWPYQGVLYAGLMMTTDGPKVLEFNARFGDPETQVQIPRLKTDLADIMMAVTNRTLRQIKIKWSDEACVGVVMASEGYPGKPKVGREVTGLNDVDKDIIVFHAGTEMRGGKTLTVGGRVLTVVATGKTLREARDKVYDNIRRIRFDGCHYRKDIALRAIDI